MTHQHVIKSLQIVELFSLMVHNEKDNTISLRAYNELKHRYKNSFEQICKDICKKNNFEKIKSLDEDVLNISLEEIFLKSSSFLNHEKKISNRAAEKYLFGWFGNISESVMKQIIFENNHFDKKHLIVPDFDDHLVDLGCNQNHKEDLEEEEKQEEAIEDEKMRKLRIFERAMERLTPREREILIEYKKVKSGYSNLSEDRIAYLCKRWKTSHDNLLHIKHRATKKLYRLYLDEQKKEDKRTSPPHS